MSIKPTHTAKNKKTGEKLLVELINGSYQESFLVEIIESQWDIEPITTPDEGTLETSDLSPHTKVIDYIWSTCRHCGGIYKIGESIYHMCEGKKKVWEGLEETGLKDKFNRSDRED